MLKPLIGRVRAQENLHIVLWLIKDTCWVMECKLAGVLMTVPTISLAAYIAFALRSDRTEFVHSLAVCCWIAANSIWMIGEFFYQDGTRPYAAAFFVLGLALIALHYVTSIIRSR